MSLLLLLLLLLLSSCASAAALHIGLVCPGHSGHLNPTGCLGAELLQRGNRVTLISTPPGASVARNNNLEFAPLGIPEYESGVLRFDLDQEAKLKGVKAFWHTIQLFKREARIILRDLPDIIQSCGIEAVCVDQLLPAAMDVADVHNIPSAVLCNALPLHLDPDVPPFVTTWGVSKKRLPRLRNQAANLAVIVAGVPLYSMLNKYRAANGLHMHGRDTLQRVGNIQLTQIPSFVDFPRTKLPNHFFYTSPWHKPKRDVDIPFPWHRLNDKKMPIVYASLGSVQTGLQSLYLAMAEACANLDVQLVMSLGRKGACLPADYDLPSNAIVVDFCPQLELLQRASVVLTHAGLNTALEALACGLPIVTIPLCNDQPGIAARLVNLGVAQAVPPGRVTANPEILQQAIETVLENPTYRSAASRYQRMLRDHCPTLAQTAELIEVGLGRSTPLLQEDPEVKRVLGREPVANLTISYL